jgi:putative NADH-flavin reductase
VRDAARAPAAKGLEVVTGDALRGADVEAALAGCEAVIYSLGAPAGKATTLFSETTRVLIAAMRKAGVQRLIAITGIGAVRRRRLPGGGDRRTDRPWGLPRGVVH